MFCKQEFLIMLLKKKRSRDDIANLLGVSVPTLSKKINGKSEFTRQEIQIIKGACDLSFDDVKKIFFADELAET